MKSQNAELAPCFGVQCTLGQECHHHIVTDQALVPCVLEAVPQCKALSLTLLEALGLLGLVDITAGVLGTRELKLLE